MRHEGDIMRLPNWAQERIRVAEMRAQEAEARVATLFGESETNTYMRYGDLDTVRPLLPNASIKFHLGPKSRHIIECRIQDGRLRVQGWDGLDVRPEASNVVTIGLEARP